MHAPAFLYGKTLIFQYIACVDSWQVCYFVQQDNMVRQAICKGCHEIIGNNGWLIVSSNSDSDLDAFLFLFGYIEILKIAYFPRAIKAALQPDLLRLSSHTLLQDKILLISLLSHFVSWNILLQRYFPSHQDLIEVLGTDPLGAVSIDWSSLWLHTATCNVGI